MQNKSTTTLETTQHLIAGLLQNDNGIEYYGIPETMEVEWIQNGKSHFFKDLDKETYRLLVNAQNSNKKYQAYIRELEIKHGIKFSLFRKTEIYTYFMYGGCDHNPDVIDGVLQEPENYRHSTDCPSLKFKKIRLNGCPLKERELKMIDLFAIGIKDEAVAMELCIVRSTLSQHKKELFDKTGVSSKPELLLAAAWQKVITPSNQHINV